MIEKKRCASNIIHFLSHSVDRAARSSNQNATTPHALTTRLPVLVQAPSDVPFHLHARAHSLYQ